MARNTDLESGHDPRFDPRFDAARAEPTGRYPIPEGSGLRAVDCVHCGNPLGVTRWEHWNGFLVMCPHCGGYHGRPWNFSRVLWAGLFLNGLSFFFVLRPRTATGMILVLVAATWGLFALAGCERSNTALELAAYSTLFFGPVLVNAVALVRHQTRLDKAPPAVPGTRA